MIAAAGLKNLVKGLSLADVQLLNESNDTVLHTGAKHNKFDTLIQLVDTLENETTEHKSVVTLLNLQNRDGETVLHLVSKSANLICFHFLVERGSDIGLQDNFGNTSLHTLLAFAKNHTEKLKKC